MEIYRPKPKRKDPFLAAIRKGREARDAGKTLKDNPYGDERTWRGGVTYARAWWKSWNDGWEARDKEIKAGLDEAAPLPVRRDPG